MFYDAERHQLETIIESVDSAARTNCTLMTPWSFQYTCCYGNDSANNQARLGSVDIHLLCTAIILAGCECDQTNVLSITPILKWSASLNFKLKHTPCTHNQQNHTLSFMVAYAIKNCITSCEQGSRCYCVPGAVDNCTCACFWAYLRSHYNPQSATLFSNHAPNPRDQSQPLYCVVLGLAVAAPTAAASFTATALVQEIPNASLHPRVSSAPPPHVARIDSPVSNDSLGPGSGFASGSSWFAGSARQLATLSPRLPYAAQVRLKN